MTIALKTNIVIAYPTLVWTFAKLEFAEMKQCAQLKITAISVLVLLDINQTLLQKWNVPNYAKEKNVMWDNVSCLVLQTNNVLLDKPVKMDSVPLDVLIIRIVQDNMSAFKVRLFFIFLDIFLEI